MASTKIEKKMNIGIFVSWCENFKLTNTAIDDFIKEI